MAESDYDIDVALVAELRRCGHKAAADRLEYLANARWRRQVAKRERADGKLDPHYWDKTPEGRSAGARRARERRARMTPEEKRAAYLKQQAAITPEKRERRRIQEAANARRRRAWKKQQAAEAAAQGES